MIARRVFLFGFAAALLTAFGCSRGGGRARLQRRRRRDGERRQHELRGGD